jgi:hypothetical protein
MKPARNRMTVVPRHSADPLSEIYRFPLPGNQTLARRVTVLDFPVSAPFTIQRVYWLHNLNPLEVRGHHAHRELQQLMVAVSGSIEIEFDNGRERRTEVLDCATEGLYVPPRLWRSIRARELHSTLLVFASAPYDESDYIRDYETFVRFATKVRGVITPKAAS